MTLKDKILSPVMGAFLVCAVFVTGLRGQTPQPSAAADGSAITVRMPKEEDRQKGEKILEEIRQLSLPSYDMSIGYIEPSGGGMTALKPAGPGMLFLPRMLENVGGVLAGWNKEAEDNNLPSPIWSSKNIWITIEGEAGLNKTNRIDISCTANPTEKTIDCGEPGASMKVMGPGLLAVGGVVDASPLASASKPAVQKKKSGAKVTKYKVTISKADIQLASKGWGSRPNKALAEEVIIGDTGHKDRKSWKFNRDISVEEMPKIINQLLSSWLQGKGDVTGHQVFPVAFRRYRDGTSWNGVIWDCALREKNLNCTNPQSWFGGASAGEANVLVP